MGWGALVWGSPSLEVPWFGCICSGIPESFISGIPWFRGALVHRVSHSGDALIQRMSAFKGACVWGQSATRRVGQGSPPGCPPLWVIEDSGDSRHSRADCHTDMPVYPTLLRATVHVPPEGCKMTGQWHNDQWCPLGGSQHPSTAMETLGWAQGPMPEPVPRVPHRLQRKCSLPSQKHSSWLLAAICQGHHGPGGITATRVPRKEGLIGVQQPTEMGQAG